MSIGESGTATANPRRSVRIRRVRVVAVLILLVGAGFAATQLIHRTEVLGIARVEARSDAVNVTIVVSHNDCNNDPTARIVGQTSDAVTVRAERRLDVPVDDCFDVGEQTTFDLVLTEPLGERSIVVDAPYGPFECVVDGIAGARCIEAGR